MNFLSFYLHSSNIIFSVPFSGDHDMAIPHVGTEKWIKSLNISIDSDWQPWYVDGQVPG